MRPAPADDRRVLTPQRVTHKTHKVTRSLALQVTGISNEKN